MNTRYPGEKVLFIVCYVKLLFHFYINSSLSLNSSIKDDSSKWIEYVKHHTEISDQHLTPEIKLHLATASQIRSKFNETLLPYYPYWRNYSPGEQALARYILDNVYQVENLSIIEIGCGCGAASIAAAMSDAHEVTANDIDPVAIAATKLNAELNNVTLKYTEQNLIGTNIAQNVIILSQVFDLKNTNNTNNTRLIEWLLEQRDERGKIVLLGDDGAREWLKMYASQGYFLYLVNYTLPQTVISEFSDTDRSHGAVYTLPLKSNNEFDF